MRWAPTPLRRTQHFDVMTCSASAADLVRDREAVGNAWSTMHLDLVRFANRPAEHAAHAQLGAARSRAPARPARPARPGAAPSRTRPVPAMARPRSRRQRFTVALADRAAAAPISVCRMRADCLIRSTVAGQSSSSYVFAQAFSRTTQTERDACAGPRPPLHSRQHAARGRSAPACPCVASFQERSAGVGRV